MTYDDYIAAVEIGDSLPGIEEAPVVINAVWAMACRHFDKLTILEIKRHGAVVVRVYPYGDDDA